MSISRMNGTVARRLMRSVIPVLFLLLFAPPTLFAAPERTGTTKGEMEKDARRMTGTPPAQARTAPVDNNQTLESAKAEHAEEVQVPPASDKAMQYYRTGNWIWLFEQVWGLLVPFLFLATGLSSKIRDFAKKIGRKWYFVIVIYFVIFSLINFAIDLPFDYIFGFLRQHSYGLSEQTFAKWMGDNLKGLGVSLAGGAIFLWIPYLLLKKSPRRWWLYTGLLTIPYFFFLSFVIPIWISPLFNHFGPMKDKTMETKILRLADRAGIEGSKIFEVDKSKDTKTVNAYVTGFLGSKRIVLWDTTLEKLTPDEVLFVMGHEMGHYVLGHTAEGVFFDSLIILVSLYLAYRIAGIYLVKYGSRLRFYDLSDIASLPMLLLMLNLFSLFLDPLSNAYSRSHEHEADRFSLELTRDNHACAASFVKIQNENLANPNPGMLFIIWRSSHPPLGSRVAFCNSYHPWSTGEPLKYDHFIHD